MDVAEQPPPWSLALLLGMLSAFAPLSIDMYLPGLPSIAGQLHSDGAHAQYTLTAFFVGLAGAQLVWGPISDRVGRRKPVFWGLGLFTAASLGCALAPNIWALMVCRFLQACGGAAGIVVARAIVRDLFTGRNIAMMLSMQMLVMGIAPILAPLLGSVLLALFGWRGIFIFLVAAGIGGGIAAWRALPETLDASAASAKPRVWAQYLAVLRDPQFRVFALASAFISAGLFAYITAASFIFVERHGMSPEGFAVLFGCNAAGIIVISQLNIRWLAWHAPAVLMRRSMMTFMAGAAVVAVVAWLGVDTPLLLAAGLFCVLAPIGAVGANAAALAMEHQRARAGQASALMGTLQFSLSAVASAAVGAANDGTARPLATVLVVCGVMALAISWRRAAPTADSPRQA